MTSSDDLESALSRWIDDDLTPAERDALRRRLGSDGEAAGLLGEYRRLDALLVGAAGDAPELDGVDFDGLAGRIGVALDRVDAGLDPRFAAQAPEPLRLPWAGAPASSGADVLPPAGWRIGPGSTPVRRSVPAALLGRALLDRATRTAAIAAGIAVAVGAGAWLALSGRPAGDPAVVAYAPPVAPVVTPHGAPSDPSAGDVVTVVAGPIVAPADVADAGITVAGPVAPAVAPAVAATWAAGSVPAEVGPPSVPVGSTGVAFVGFAADPLAAVSPASPSSVEPAADASVDADDRPLVAVAPFVRPSRVFIAARGVPRDAAGLY